MENMTKKNKKLCIVLVAIFGQWRSSESEKKNIKKVVPTIMEKRPSVSVTRKKKKSDLKLAKLRTDKYVREKKTPMM